MINKLEIEKLRNNKLTYREIGDKFGITKQRVHQVYKDYKPTDYDIIKRILKRDNYKCFTCGEGFENNLEVHHINGIKKDNREVNLLTFCRKHHLELEKAARQDGFKEKIIHFSYSRRKTEKFNCLNCGLEITDKPSTKRRFCSRKCFAIKRTK